MKTYINIRDEGSNVVASAENGILKVIDNGGCPVEQILADVSFAPRRKIASIASDALAAWSVKYDGDPHECGLTVRVKRGENEVTAKA